MSQVWFRQVMTMADEQFYKHDRPPNPELPEDRPRGRGTGPPGPPAQHSTTWKVVMVILAIVVVIVFGIMLFP